MLVEKVDSISFLLSTYIYQSFDHIIKKKYEMKVYLKPYFFSVSSIKTNFFYKKKTSI
jgi:hypothetical protein